MVWKDLRYIAIKQITKAEGRRNIWRAVKQINKSGPRWDMCISREGREVKDEEEVGEMFKEFIVNKTWRMRGGINMENKRDPLGPLAGDMKKKEIPLFTL